MRISSPAFGHQETIPSKYTCDGTGISPELSIEDVPQGSQSLALIMEDPDAVSGTFIHWTVWNIDTSTRNFEEDAAPVGATEGLNSAREIGYHRPCPPYGTHRYFFKLYALDIRLDLPSGAVLSELETAMAGHILDQTEFYGLYSRA